MFSRWRQENFFRYMRAHYALDGPDVYTTTPDDPDRLIPNPARKHADGFWGPDPSYDSYDGRQARA